MSNKNRSRELLAPQFNGWMALAAILVFGAVGALFLLSWPPELAVIGGVLLLTLLGFLAKGFFIVEPNEAVLMLFFGSYSGTEKNVGFRWCNPFYERRKISLRARNFNSDTLKVNDQRGNPIEISSIIVWRVKDTAQASFDVDNYINYVRIQTESALRNIATHYPYDSDDQSPSLRTSMEEVTNALVQEIEQRVSQAGVSIDEARINHLAYAPEIAAAMLQKQQADAVILARKSIVQGAVDMVQETLQQLHSEGVVMSETEKASFISNLMIVLCADSSTQPVVNVGS